jgi:pimeloyl-ACP methyl ester carboxylesterase
MEGVSGLSQGLMCLDGYKGAPFASTSVPLNDYYEQLAGAVLDVAATQHFMGQVNRMCVGHSLGGAVAEIVAGRMHAVSRIANINYCSFGSPKPASWPALASVNQCVNARWFAAEDPVPLLIPSSNDNAAMLLAFGVRENIRFTNFAQPFGGLELSGIGNVSPASFPTQAAIGPITNIAAWLYSLDTTAGQAHSLQSYIDRLTNNVVNNPDAADRPTQADFTNQQEQITRRELTEQQRIALARLQEQERLQHVGPVNVPPDFKATVIRVGRVWNVVVRNQVVAMSVRERTARSSARKYNAWIESVLTQGIVDQVSLTAQVAEFFKRASDPTSAITPKLNDQLADE